MPEFGLALGAISWGLGGFITDDYKVGVWGQVILVAAILLGFVRGLVLTRLCYAARVVLTALSAMLIAWLWWGLAARYGIIGIGVAWRRVRDRVADRGQIQHPVRPRVALPR